MAKAAGAKVNWPKHVPFDRAIELAEWARDQVKRLGAELRGVIFNGFDARKVHRRGYGRYGYYGYYGYYGRYRGYGYGYGEERKSKKGQESETASRL